MKRIARLPHFAGVILACGCLIGVLGFGPRSGMGFLLTPMSSAHSWGRDVFALALAIQMLLWGAAQPFAGATAAFEQFREYRTFHGCHIEHGLDPRLWK